MSEAEKQRRLLYKLNRKKWMQIIAIVLGALFLLSLVSSVLLIHFNQTYYIDYVQKSDVDYWVSLKENDFYESAFAEEGKAYVASLINQVHTNFTYDVLMDADNVSFVYTYRVEAYLAVKDKNGGVVFDKTEVLLPEKTVSEMGNALSVSQAIAVDYGTYASLADRFVSTYALEDTESSLTLRMFIDVNGACEEFVGDSKNAYVVSLSVPLSSQIVNMTISSTVEEGDNQILAYENETVKNVFVILTVILWILSALAGVFLLVFALLTRSTDINYEIKRNRILQTYKPFIQKINNNFASEGYQLILVDTFKEMLEIRDTIQSPILMFENEDATRTCFYIPTNTDLLYVFDLRIEDYDEIYRTESDDEDRVMYVANTQAPAYTASARTDNRNKKLIRNVVIGVCTVFSSLLAAKELSDSIKKAPKQNVETMNEDNDVPADVTE